MERTFNKEQLIAINHKKGPMLVLAGAGSGKTTVLTYRIHNLIANRSVKPQNILVLTFTKAAASEMEERFYKLMQRKVKVKFGTFHSVFLEILISNTNYRYADIASPRQQAEAIERAAYQMNYYLGAGDEVQDKTHEILRNIELVKNKKNETMDLETKDFYEYYQAYMTENHLIDFSDMLLMTYQILVKNESILKFYQDCYRYILVDEYQDTNPIQNAILMLLSQPRNNLFCVGDDDQSIYGFRGSDPAVMLEFPKQFKNAQIVQLPVNYRCNQGIVTASNRLISYNHQRYEKNIYTVRSGDGVIIQTFDNQQLEFQYVEDKILQRQHQIPYEENICLFRTKRGIEQFAIQLIKKGIPFFSTEPINNLFDHFIARDLMSYVECALGNQDSLYRIINKPKRYVEKRYIKPGITLEKLSRIYCNKDYVIKRLRGLEVALKKLSEKRPKELLQSIYKDIQYKEYLKDYIIYRKLNDRQADELYATAKQVIDFCGAYESVKEMEHGIEKYIEKINQAAKRKKGKEGRAGRVMLSTIHAAKGLEYQQVFIFDVNKRNLPFERKGETCDIEEERRLMYVAATRAKDFLHVLFLKDEESIFIPQMQRSPREFMPGCRVLHKIFGTGTIENINHPYIAVRFDDNPLLRFDLEYAITNDILSLIL